MLKKIMSGALSVVMLSSCMECNVDAAPRLPQGYINNLITISRMTHWWKIRMVNGREVEEFNRNAFNRFYVSYLARPENRDLGIELINQLFEAEIISLSETGPRPNAYRRTYNQLMAQYEGNEQVQLALEEIDEFLVSCNNITIQANDFDDGSFVNLFTPLIHPELKRKLINMNPVLRRDILRLETLHSLYRLIVFPSTLGRHGSFPSTFFHPWLGEVNVSSSSYGSLLSCVLLIYSRRKLPIYGPKGKTVVKENPIDSIKNIENFVLTLEVNKWLPHVHDDLSIKTFITIGNLLNDVISFPKGKTNRPVLDDLMIRIIGQLENGILQGPTRIK